MVEETRGITVKIPADLHAKVKTEQESLEFTMSQYIQQVLEEHFSGKEGKTMEATRTLAFQVSEDLFQRVKQYLAAHPNLTQKQFVISLIEEALEDYEAEQAAEQAVGGQEGQGADDEDNDEESPDEGGYGPDSAQESPEGEYGEYQDAEDSPEAERDEMTAADADSEEETDD